MKVWTEILKALGGILSGLVPAALVSGVSAGLVMLDIAVFKMECDELGIVELSQSLILASIVVIMCVSAVKHRDLRGGFVLSAGLFLDMFIREQDQVLEMWLPHGVWIYPVILMTVLACGFAAKRPETVRNFLVYVRESRRFQLLAVGFLIVIGFARVFGMKPIWQTIAGMDDFRVAKHVAEEGAELLGYTIILYWAILFHRDLASAKSSV